MPQHVDDDIDLALDDPAPTGPGAVYNLARIAAALVLLAAASAAYTGHLTVESKALPGAMTALFLLGIIAAANRHPAR